MSVTDVTSELWLKPSKTDPPIGNTWQGLGKNLALQTAPLIRKHTRYKGPPTQRPFTPRGPVGGIGSKTWQLTIAPPFHLNPEFHPLFPGWAAQ